MKIKVFPVYFLVSDNSKPEVGLHNVIMGAIGKGGEEWVGREDETGRLVITACNASIKLWMITALRELNITSNI